MPLWVDTINYLIFSIAIILHWWQWQWY